MKKIIGTTLGVVVLAGTPVVVQAQSADALIDKLVSKGVLTLDEAQELREEADKGFNSAFQVKTGLPDWVTSMRISGDMRGRYESFHADDPTFVDRNRFRYRIRPGIFATLRDQFEIGFRLSSGEPTGTFGGDPISGNTTFQDNAAKKFAYIDLAYAKWAAINNSIWSGTFTLGKMENPFVFSDMVFDGDYTPEGFAQQFVLRLSETQSLKFNLGQFAVDEISTSSQDPFLFGAQVRLDSQWQKHLSTSLGIAGLALTSEQNLSENAAAPAIPNVNRGNTRAAGRLVNEYTPLVADAQVTYTLESFPRYSGAFPVRLGGEYIINPGADAENEAYALGITFGKAGKKGLWEIGYRWKHLEADAWWEELVDSDFGGLYPAAVGGRASYGAGTNVEGHIFKAAYSPYDSLTIGLTYFLAHVINASGGYDENIGRLQLDAVWKF